MTDCSTVVWAKILLAEATLVLGFYIDSSGVCRAKRVEVFMKRLKSKVAATLYISFKFQAILK